MANPRLGGKIRRLRRERKLTQTQMAQELGVSPSYLNLIEHNQRPITVAVLVKLAQRFQINMESFGDEDDGRLAADLSEAFSDPLFDTHDITQAELDEMVALSPNLGAAVLTLYQAWRGASGAKAPTDILDGETPAEAGAPSEEVSDFLEQRGNYFGFLESAAEGLWREHGLALETLSQDLVKLLASNFAVDVAIEPAERMGASVREFRPLTRRLLLSELLPPASRTFQLAHQLALLGWRKEIDLAVANYKFTSDEAMVLARIALANYFAAALLMPYERFREAAKATRYDLTVLEHRFGVSFEQACHRLTTLRRPGSEGIPFHLIRVDIAGNISKRFGGSGIRIARFGAACPRWNVYDAFATPGMLRIQISEMPDGGRFFCLSRTVSQPGRNGRFGLFGQRASRLAIGLGCALEHAKEFVHSEGLSLDDPRIVTPIGVSCRLCERVDCSDRAAPSIHRRLAMDENRRGISAYAMSEK